MTPEYEKKIDVMYQLLVGNEELRQKGIMERLEILEKDKQKRIIRHAKIVGIASGISLTGGYLLSIVLKWWEETFK